MLKFDQDECEGGLLEKGLASEIACCVGMDLPLLWELDPVVPGSTVHAVGSRGGVGVGTLLTPASQKLPLGERSKKGGVLGIGVGIVNLVVILEDDRVYIVWGGSLLRIRVF